MAHPTQSMGEYIKSLEAENKTLKEQLAAKSKPSPNPTPPASVAGASKK